MKLNLRLESCGTLIGFDSRMSERPYFTSSGMVREATTNAGKDPISGISWHMVGNDKLVTKPTEAVMSVIVAQPGSNSLSALELMLTNFGENTPNHHELKARSAVIKECVHIKADIVSHHSHLFLRDKAGNPVVLPKNITDKHPEWRTVSSHTSTNSAKGAIGRVIREVAYYHAPWMFNAEITIDNDTPDWLDDEYVHKLFIIGGKYIGLGAGRTRVDGAIRGFGRFVAVKV